MFHRLLNNAYPIHITAPPQHPQQAFPALSATNTPHPGIFYIPNTHMTEPLDVSNLTITLLTTLSPTHSPSMSASDCQPTSALPSLHTVNNPVLTTLHHCK